MDSCAGNPINIGTGNKYQPETDYQGAGDFPLVFKRTYNSDASTVSERLGAGSGWRHSYERSITSAANSSLATAYRADGSAYDFTLTANNWLPAADVNLKLSRSASPDTWLLTTEDGSVETYNATGKLQSIKSRAGTTQTLAYDANGLLTAVTHSSGRSLTLSYDNNLRVATLQDTAGGLYRYGYNGSTGNLETVTYPDQAMRTYLYNESAYVGANLPHALTGIIDENNHRFATFQYDAQNRAISTQHAGGAELISVAYGSSSNVVTDALNTARTHRFQTIQGVIKSIGSAQPAGAGCNASASAVSYDVNGNIASRTDFNGVKTTYQYDTARNLEIRRTEAAGTAQARTITTQWHSTFRLPVKIAEPKGIQTFAYDAKGLLTRRTASSLDGSQSRTWTYAYNAQGQVTQVDGPRGDVADVTLYAYDAAGNLATVTDALGHVTGIPRYDAHGRPLTVIDPNGLLTRLAYDARGRVLSLNVGGEITRYAYDAAGQPIQTARPDGATLAYAYDAAHRLVQIRDNHGDKIAYTLDPMGNRVKEDWQDPDGALAKSLQRQIDALNRLAALTGAQGQKTQFAYDDNGKLASSTDPLLRTTQYGYDALDRLIDSTDPAGAKAHYGYDAAGRLSQVADRNGNATRYGYDGLGNAITTDSPDAGLTQKQFDAAGNVISSLDARGVQAHYVYDAQNRLTGIDTPNDLDTRYTYDQGANALGKLSRIDDASGSTQWQYDAHGRVTQKTQAVDSVNLNLAYSYDAAGRLTQMTYPSGAKVLYQYDAERIAGMSLILPPATPMNNGKGKTAPAPTPQTLLNQIHYNALGAPLGWTFGNGSAYTRQYDPDGRPLSYPLGAGTRTLSYDAAGQITGYQGSAGAATQALGLANKVNQDQSFAYDLAGRLLSVDNPGWQLAYGLDANGNRISQSVTELDAGTTRLTQYHYTLGSNRLDSAATSDGTSSYRFDAAGHLTDDGKHRYTYNDAGRLVQTERSEYRHNGLGQRVAKTVNRQTTLFVYDRQGQLIGEYDATGKAIQETVYLGRTPVALSIGAQNPGQAGIYYIHTDHLNAPRVILDQANQPAWTWDADPYGNAWNQNPQAAAKGRIAYHLRFPGQYYDQETGLYYNYFRDYDPKTGTYIESDPIGLGGGLNPYAYVRNNPVRFVDPNGLNPFAGAMAGATVGGPVGAVIGAAIGSLIGVGGYIWYNNQDVDDDEDDYYKPKTRDKKLDKCDPMGGEDSDPFKGQGPKKGTKEYEDIRRELEKLKEISGRGGKDNIDPEDPNI